jgi:hypothetical protein
MKKQFGTMAGLCLLFTGMGFAGSGTAFAQGTSATPPPPPNVLVIMREFIKPGKAGSPHEKTESAFVKAMSDAKEPEHYLALNSLTGKSRALFLLGYDSFAAWQKDNDAMMANSSLSSAMDSAQIADGDLLESYDAGVFTYNEDLSLRAGVNIPDMRFFEITVFNIRPGHVHEWTELVKLYKEALSKTPNAHWATFETMYGAPSDRYLVISPIKSVADVDQEMSDNKKMASMLSADDKKKMADLTAAAVESSTTNLLAVNPKMSYVVDSWKTASPDFWGKQ